MSDERLPWDDEAEKLLEFMPPFVRPIARGKIEKAAREDGVSRITADYMHANKERLMG